MNKVMEDFSGFFGLLDENFLDGFIKIDSRFHDFLLQNGNFSSSSDLKTFFDHIINNLNVDTGVSKDETLRRVFSFFDSLDYSYGQMARNLFRDFNYVKGNSLDSAAYESIYSGNDQDGSILVHELAHAFAYSKEQAGRSVLERVSDDRYAPLGDILSEISSYVFQFLYYDFLEKQIGKKIDKNDLLLSILVLDDLYEDISYVQKDKTVFQYLSQGKIMEHLEEINDHFCIDLYSAYDAQFPFSNKMLNYVHEFGIMIACYIYQMILEDPQNISICSILEEAQATVGGEEQILRKLEQKGVPGFKDGKISLDDETVSILSDSLIKAYKFCSTSNDVKHY